jgi:hypothetical protein
VTPAGTVARGYGEPHRRLRAKWQTVLDLGELVPCANPSCQQPGVPVDPAWWDLGHTDDRTGYRGPEHRSCNRREGQRKAARGAQPVVIDYQARW